MNNLPDVIKEHLWKKETVLWWSRPNIKKMFKVEKVYVFSPISVILYAVLFARYLNPYNAERAIFFTFIIIPLLLYCIYDCIRWFVIKNNTYFVITNSRVLIIFKEWQEFHVTYLYLQYLEYFEIVKSKRGGNLNLGRYRLGSFMHFDYVYEVFEIFLRHDSRSNWSFKGYMFDNNYFSFFDLDDPDTPAQIIRERTNAKEYIDHDKKLQCFNK